MESLENFIKDEIANLAFKRVSSEESLVKSRLLDSIILVELVVAIEEKTGKVIPQYLITPENFDTVNKICETVGNIKE